jgi:hypothetical protein
MASEGVPARLRFEFEARLVEKDGSFGRRMLDGLGA